MPYIFLLLFAILFTACTNSATNSPTFPSELPMSNQTTDIDDLKIAPENSIVGKYTLSRGAFSHGSIYQEIDEGYLVIEELEVNNYGYYYVTVVGKLSPETHSGIFFEKGGKFVQKVIYDQEATDGVKSEITTIDNISITYDENILKIIIDSNKKESTIWDRDDGTKQASEKIKLALKEAEHEYYKYYKEKCDHTKLKCADREYTPVNE